MARKPSGNPTGRPVKEVNWTSFENLCRIQCTQMEIANVLEVHFTNLIMKVEEHYGEPFASVYSRFADGGKASLRRIQFKLAEKNANMSIWLGKTYLKQREPAIEIDVGEDTVKHFDALMNQISNLQAKDQAVPEAASSE
jgi:hypothetical protein